MGDAPSIYAKPAPRKPLQTLDHAALIQAGQYRVALCRDLGHDASTAEAILAELAGLWAVVARRAATKHQVETASVATRITHELCKTLGVQRRSQDMGTVDATADAVRPLASLVPARRARRAPAQDAFGSAGAHQVDAPAAPATCDAPAAAAPPGATSATPPRSRTGDPGRAEIAANFADAPHAGEATTVDAVESDAMLEQSCPDCGAVLTPAGQGAPPLVCEACGWPPVLEADDECDAAGDPL